MEFWEKTLGHSVWTCDWRNIGIAYSVQTIVVNDVTGQVLVRVDVTQIRSYDVHRMVEPSKSNEIENNKTKNGGLTQLHK